MPPAQTSPVKNTTAQKQRTVTASRALSELQQERNNKPARLPFSKLFRVYLVPLLVVGIFATILFVLIVPNIGAIFEQLDKTAQANSALVALDGRVQFLQQMAANDQQTTADLARLNAIMPEAVTEVVNFQQQVRRMMNEQNGLTVGASTTAEQAIAAITTAEVGEDSPVVVLEIPSTFSAIGRIQQIRSFISDIKELDSFVTIGEMRVDHDDNFSAETLNQIDNSNQWRLTITLIKYQFANVSDAQQVRQLYIDKAENSRLNQEVLDYIRSKVQ